MKRRLLFLPCLLLLAAVGVLSGAPPAPTGRAAFLAGGLSDEQFIVLSANFAASGHRGALLLDSPGARRHIRSFLGQYKPDQVTPIGSFPKGVEALRQELGGWIAPPVEWDKGPPEAVYKLLFPKAEAVVVCPAGPRRLLLQAACLAGAAHAPLYVVHGAKDEEMDLRRRLAAWGTRKVFAVGEALAAVRDLPEGSVVILPDEKAVTTAYLVRQMRQGTVPTLVVANPADFPRGHPGLSSLAPYVAIRHHAALLLTGDKGTDAGPVILAALKDPALRRAENLILVGDRRAIAQERRKNPLPGADRFVDVEPPGPGKDKPFSFATGRLFHREPGVVMLMLARAELIALSSGPPRALVVTNPDSGLQLLETISRNTVNEFVNAGYKTDAMFGRQANRGAVQRLLPKADVFLWEGHFGTLLGYGVARWHEPLRPSLVFLQSCLALSEPNAQPFLERGAVGVIGSPVRTYSATGGALTMAYFDALLYDGETLGGSLRQAKNFLIAYAKLKEQRLGPKARLGGANIRSAWAFTLWGDPTLHLPPAAPPKGALPRVQAEVLGDRISLVLPQERYPKVATGRYQVAVRPNGRLAGLVTKEEGDPRKILIPMLFAEVHLKAHGGKRPRLASRVPADHWVFLWDARLHTGYLLVRPRRRDRDEIRFFVSWEE